MRKLTPQWKCYRGTRGWAVPDSRVDAVRVHPRIILHLTSCRSRSSEEKARDRDNRMQILADRETQKLFEGTFSIGRSDEIDHPPLSAFSVVTPSIVSNTLSRDEIRRHQPSAQTAYMRSVLQHVSARLSVSSTPPEFSPHSRTDRLLLHWVLSHEADNI